ncbi:MAG: DUF308 domain-containing protein [Propionibacteriaceae bacterium]|jgi:uncharacterized membrane protein HdeD (DUF308 family)|nr:DUF308 domain-containing protein [Propionibacteriaceae bacterium]
MTHLAFEAPPEQKVVSSIRAALGITGLVSLVIGVLILFQPKGVGMVIAGFLAAYVLIAGLAYLGIGIFSSRLGLWPRIGHLVLGALFLVAAIVTFANLGAAVAALALVIGIMIGITWIIEGIVAITLLPDAGSKVWTVIYAVISILGGIALVTSPLWGTALLFWLLGIWLVVMGIVQIVRAFRFGAVAAS